MSKTLTSRAKNICMKFLSFCMEFLSFCMRFFSFCFFFCKSNLLKIHQRFLSKNDETTFLLYCVLVGLLIAMLLILLISSFFFPFTIAGVLARISLAFPFVWLASHVNGLINKRNKLYTEYEHKQAVMEFYVVFKDEVKKDDKMREAFAKAITDVVLRFPSIIGEAQESDSPMDKILNTIKGKDKNLEEKVKNLAKGKKDAT